MSRFWSQMTEADWELWRTLRSNQRKGIRHRYDKAEKRVVRLTALHSREQKREKDVGPARATMIKLAASEKAFRAMLEEEAERLGCSSAEELRRQIALSDEVIDEVIKEEKNEPQVDR